MLARWARPVVIVDAATGAPVSGGGGGGGDATAAKQDEQTELLEDISAKLDVATAIDQTTGGTTNGVVLKKANGDVVDPDAPAIIDSGVKLVPVTLSTDTNPYAAGDLLADAQIVAACVRANDSAGMLASIVLIDEADQGAAMTIYFASANASFGTENSAPGITDANARNILGFIDIATGDYKDLGGVKVAFKQNCNIPVSPAAGTDDIYVAVVNGAGTPTFAADSLKLRLGFLI